jgi:hypothetical protein
LLPPKPRELLLPQPAQNADATTQTAIASKAKAALRNEYFSTFNVFPASDSFKPSAIQNQPAVAHAKIKTIRNSGYARADPAPHATASILLCAVQVKAAFHPLWGDIRTDARLKA